MYKTPTTHNITSKPNKPGFMINKKKGGKNMKNITKLLIGICMLFLVMGVATAFEIKDLKTLDGYTQWDNNGQSNYTTNNNRYFLVEKISTFDNDYKDEWFKNHSEYKYSVKPVGDNIYRMNDDTFNFYGYQEVIKMDGDYYMVSINQNSKLSPSEENGFLKDIQEFNKLNDLKPVEI